MKFIRCSEAICFVVVLEGQAKTLNYSKIVSVCPIMHESLSKKDTEKTGVAISVETVPLDVASLLLGITGIASIRLKILESECKTIFVNTEVIYKISSTT